MSESNDRDSSEQQSAAEPEAPTPSTAHATEPTQEASKEAAADPRTSGPLAPAWAALEKGDHVEAARIARELAKSDDETTRNDATAFLKRLEPDPVILMVFAGTALLIVLLAWQYLGHRH